MLKVYGNNIWFTARNNFCVRQNSIKQKHKRHWCIRIFFLETGFGIILWIPFSVISGINLANIPAIFPIVFLSAILSEAYIFYIYSKGKLAIIATVFSTYSLYTILFSHLLNNESLPKEILPAIALIITGVLLISFKDNFRIKNSADIKAILWATSGAIAVGFSDTISKSSIDNTSVSELLFCLAIAQIPVSIAYLKYEKYPVKQLSKNILRNTKRYKMQFLAAFFMAIGMIFFWLTFENMPASIASPITATNVMFSVISARILLKERINKKGMLGIFLILISIFVISLSE